MLHERYNCDVCIDSSVFDEILKRTTRSENGARMLEAIIEGDLLPPVSLALLSKLAEQKPIECVTLTVREGEFVGEVA